MLLEFTNGIDIISVKTGKEWYPILFIGLFFFPFLFLIGAYFAFTKKQVSLTVINLLIIYVIMTFVTAFIFTFSSAYVPNTFDPSLFVQSKAAVGTMVFFIALYIFTTIKLILHVGEYHVNQLIKKGFYLVDENDEKIKEVQRCSKYKKPFWVLDY